jgi:hypothetical protein
MSGSFAALISSKPYDCRRAVLRENRSLSQCALGIKISQLVSELIRRLGFRKAKQNDEAERYFEQAIQHYPDFAEAPLGLAAVLLEKTNPQRRGRL